MASSPLWLSRRSSWPSVSRGVAVHLLMGLGDAHGEDLLRTAQAAAARQAKRPVDGAAEVR
jgi:hypothetical protein